MEDISAHLELTLEYDLLQEAVAVELTRNSSDAESDEGPDQETRYSLMVDQSEVLKYATLLETKYKSLPCSVLKKRAELHELTQEFTTDTITTALSELT